jgi:hypothetical protein
MSDSNSEYSLDYEQYDPQKEEMRAQELMNEGTSFVGTHLDQSFSLKLLNYYLNILSLSNPYSLLK